MILLTFKDSTLPEWQTIADLVIPQRDAYCNKHDYFHCTILNGWGDRSDYYAVQRLQCVRDLLADEKNGTSVWVLNLAAVITDPSKPVTDFLTRKLLNTDAAIHICRDRNGLNAGSFIIRKTPRTDLLLHYCIERARWSGHPWWEQEALQVAEFDPAFTYLFEVVDPPAFNQYFHALYGWPTTDRQNWQPGNFCVHFPGRPLPERVKLVREALAWVAENG